MSSHEKIRKFRIEKNLSQAELAARINITRNYLSLIESGKKIPSIATLLSLADALDVVASQLIADNTEIMKLRELIDRDRLRAARRSLEQAKAENG